MKIGILGTGAVGRSLAARLNDLGHYVMIGTRAPRKTLARAHVDAQGIPPFQVWYDEHPGVQLGSFRAAAAHGELVVNATPGAVSLDALRLVDDADLNGKVLLDVANPLDFSHGMPPALLMCNSDSLAEQIQRLLPGARVVKALNTVNASVMVHPQDVGDGDHTVFVSGNNEDAKATVAALLRSFGWTDIVDLGDITTARGAEMLLAMWLRLYGVLHTPATTSKSCAESTRRQCDEAAGRSGTRGAPRRWRIHRAPPVTALRSLRGAEQPQARRAVSARTPSSETLGRRCCMPSAVPLHAPPIWSSGEQLFQAERRFGWLRRWASRSLTRSQRNSAVVVSAPNFCGWTDVLSGVIVAEALVLPLPGHPRPGITGVASR
jgi:8-hydroxy-5-deazaflavin:NADPH oxidoreductase